MAPATAALVLGATVVVVLVLGDSPAGGPVRDEPAPDVTFALLDGGSTTLDEVRADRPLVLNFFASWCPPCAAEMPDLEAVNLEFDDRVAFVGINMQDRPADARRLVESTGVSYPIGMDPDGDLFILFGGYAMPTTVFISSNGTIAEVFSGVLDGDGLRTRTEALLP